MLYNSLEFVKLLVLLKALSCGFSGGLLSVFPLILRVSLLAILESPSQERKPIFAPVLSNTFKLFNSIVMVLLPV